MPINFKSYSRLQIWLENWHSGQKRGLGDFASLNLIRYEPDSRKALRAYASHDASFDALIVKIGQPFRVGRRHEKQIRKKRTEKNNRKFNPFRRAGRYYYQFWDGRCSRRPDQLGKV